MQSLTWKRYKDTSAGPVQKQFTSESEKEKHEQSKRNTSYLHRRDIMINTNDCHNKEKSPVKFPQKKLATLA